jgi:hypothetical protein
MIKLRYLFIILFLTCSSVFLFSDISDARLMYNNGNLDESLTLYDQWLKENRSSQKYSEVLSEILELEGNVNNICSLVAKHIDIIEDKNIKKDLLGNLASLHELSSNLQDAQILYQKAAYLDQNIVDYDYVFKSSKILLLEGEFSLAELQLKEIIFNSQDPEIITQAKIYLTMLILLESGDNPTIEISSIEQPELLYILYLLQKNNTLVSANSNYKEDLLKDFELSPEAEIIRNHIQELPGIINSFGLLFLDSNNNPISNTVDTENLLENLNFSIQAGSFNDPENAHYLAEDLKSYGFSPIIKIQKINNIDYSKVILYYSNEIEMRKALDKLRLKGFQGFPIY